MAASCGCEKSSATKILHSSHTRWTSLQEEQKASTENRREGVSTYRDAGHSHIHTETAHTKSDTECNVIEVNQDTDSHDGQAQLQLHQGLGDKSRFQPDKKTRHTFELKQIDVIQVVLISVNEKRKKKKKRMLLIYLCMCNIMVMHFVVGIVRYTV